MLEKLLKQTAIYGISTIAVRFLSYLLTPYYTNTFAVETYGIITDVYALVPLALTILTMGMESSYFRFAAKADAAGGDIVGAKRTLFATTWGATIYASILFFICVIFFQDSISGFMGKSYTLHPEYVLWVGAIILLDVSLSIPFSRLREQGRSITFVGLKALSAITNIGLAISFGFAGLYETSFGVGWVFIANFTASLITLIAILFTTNRVIPKINWALLSTVLVYSLPLLIGGVMGTANEFIDRQLIKFFVPENAMYQLGIYGAITKITVVMMLLYQVYRLAAEPFFLSNFKSSDFKTMNAVAMKYYIIISLVTFLFMSLFKDAFALIVGADFREGIDVLPIILVANILAGIWLNLSFWYKREEKTVFSIVITGVGLLAILVFGIYLIPRWGYYGAAWARVASESVMVGVSLWLNQRYFPIKYDWTRIGEYVVVCLILFFIGENLVSFIENKLLYYTLNLFIFAGYALYVVRREHLDIVGLVRTILKRG